MEGRGWECVSWLIPRRAAWSESRRGNSEPILSSLRSRSTHHTEDIDFSLTQSAHTYRIVSHKGSSPVELCGSKGMVMVKMTVDITMAPIRSAAEP